jgi:hypothetical protein
MPPIEGREGAGLRLQPHGAAMVVDFITTDLVRVRLCSERSPAERKARQMHRRGPSFQIV